jgi:hypothetical protein
MLNIVRTFSAITALLLAAHVFSSSVYAQGMVKGKIRNMRGETISGAAVTARQNGRDVRSASSNSKGEFSLGGLEPGFYNIVIDAKGYNSSIYRSAIEIKDGKTVDLGDRLILQIDRGTQVIVQGSVFFKDGTSVTAAKVEIERVASDGSVRKITTVYTNISGEFTFRQPETGPTKYRMTVKYHDATAAKEMEVSSAAVYRTAISLDIDRSN